LALRVFILFSEVPETPVLAAVATADTAALSLDGVVVLIEILVAGLTGAPTPPACEEFRLLLGLPNVSSTGVMDTEDETAAAAAAATADVTADAGAPAFLLTVGVAFLVLALVLAAADGGTV